MIELLKINNLDFQKIIEWKSDPIMSEQIMTNIQLINEKEAKDWIKKNSEDKNQKLNGIYFVEGNQRILMGVTRLMFIDFNSGTTELGIYIGSQENQNVGIGGEALDLTVKQAFEELNLRKIFLRVNEQNKRAMHLYLKKGFEIEGNLKCHFLNRSHQFENIIYMSLFNQNQL